MLRKAQTQIDELLATQQTLYAQQQEREDALRCVCMYGVCVCVCVRVYV